MVSLFWLQAEDPNEDISIALIPSGQSFISEALQGHSGDSIIDLAMQDHVLISPGVFPYIYHVGSNFNLSSILSNGLIPGGQELSRKTICVLLAC